MKLHLLFVFFLAAPLVGRLLSGDSSPALDACDSNDPKAAEVQPVVPAEAAAPAAKPTPASTPETRASTSPATPSKTPAKRAPRARSVTFM